MVQMYLYTKHELSMLRGSTVIARQTDRKHYLATYVNGNDFKN